MINFVLLDPSRPEVARLVAARELHGGKRRLKSAKSCPTISLDCIFAGVDVDHRDYSIKFVTNDGSELKFSLRGLFEQFFDELKGR